MKHHVIFQHPLFCLLAFLWFLQPAAAQNSIEPTKAQQDALDKLYAPLRERVTGILLEDKTGQYERYLNDLEAIGSEPDRGRKREMLKSLRQNHYDFIRRAYQNAKINQAELKPRVADILRHNKFVIDEFGGIRIESGAPNLVLPLRFDATFECPLGANEGFENSSVIGRCETSFLDCRAKTLSFGEIVGGCRSKASIGDQFNLTQGTFHKINVSAKYDLNYYGFAMAFAGYSQANAKVGVRLKGPGFDQTVIVKESVCIAPIIWYNEFEVTALNFLAQADFTGVFNGNNEFTALAYFETFAIGGLAAGSYSDNRGEEFDFVKVAAQE